MVKEFYNENKKNEYLDTISNEQIKRNCGTLFFKSAAFEKMLNKDICEFNYDNFKLFFEKSNYVTAGMFTCNKSLLKNYLKWCILQKYCFDNCLIELERIKQKDIQGHYMTFTKYFKSIDDLLDCIIGIYQYHQCDPSLYEPLACFYGLYWYGLDSDEICTIKSEQFDLGNKSITVGEKTIEVSKRFIGICIRAADYDALVGLDNKTRGYAESIYVFKSVRSSQINTPIDANFHNQKNKIWKHLMEDTPITHPYYGKVLSTMAIKRCGEFYRMYQQEQNGVIIDKNYIKGLIPDNEFDSEMALSNYCFNRLKDYSQWKNFILNE